MIVQNCLKLLSELHHIEEEIQRMKELLGKHNIQIDDDTILKELVQKKINNP